MLRIIPPVVVSIAVKQLLLCLHHWWFLVAVKGVPCIVNVHNVPYIHVLCNFRVVLFARRKRKSLNKHNYVYGIIINSQKLES